MHLFANNEAINKWLGENPIILGSGAVVFGLIFLGLGLVAFVRGRAPTRRGADLEGATP